jgi:hypothetical protein
MMSRGCISKDVRNPPKPTRERGYVTNCCTNSGSEGRRVRMQQCRTRAIAAEHAGGERPNRRFAISYHLHSPTPP